MDEDAGWRVVDDRRVVIADILDSLAPEQWATPSLCDSWSVRDVGAHLGIAATSSVGEMVPWVLRARGSFDRMVRDSAIDRARRPTDEIVSDLRGIVGSRRLAPLTFWRDPLLDAVVHAHDIARPLGITVAAPVEAAREAVDWVWFRRFPFFPARRLRGLRLVASDVAWDRGDGLELRGPIESLLLVSTGRPAGLAELDGPGRELAESRLGPSARP